MSRRARGREPEKQLQPFALPPPAPRNPSPTLPPAMCSTVSCQTGSTVVEQGKTDDELTKLNRFAKFEHDIEQSLQEEVEETIAFMEALFPRPRPSPRKATL